MAKRYNPKEIEPKWQKIWDETEVYKADLSSDKPKYIAMSMFNYPSGAGIHIGHAMNYTISDVKARFMRQQGSESYHPIGWDAFGLPAENYAIKAGVSPQASMAKIIPSYHTQYKAMGWSNDWSKEIATHEPIYYKWTQWIFSQMYKHGLAYQDARMQWWCEKCQTVLANEQVIDGKCWRHDGPDDPIVEKKEVKQWFFKITEYADDLLEATDSLDWTESVKLAQKNWIGKSKGAEVDFMLEGDLTGRNFVGIHGFGGSSKEVFWPWLKQEIESRGGVITILDLPSADAPNVEDQADYVIQNCTFDSKTTLITHSLGGPVAMKLLPKLNSDIDALVMVAPPLETKYRDNKPRPKLDAASDWKFDFASVRSKVNKVTVLADTDDHVIINSQPEKIANELNGKFIISKAKSTHFRSDNEPLVLAQVAPKVSVFTTRPDTLFGATFLVLAPEHELVDKVTTQEQKQTVEDYVKKAEQKSELERQSSKEKTGVFTGAYVINPVNNQKVPIWIADYVLTGYGTGAIMAVPAHDERDWEFAKKYDLPVTRVVKNKSSDEECTQEEGVMQNSGKYDGMPSADAREKIVQDLESRGLATEKTNYKMRDWSVSRQRYWGAPIPIIDCQKCGQVLVPDEDLPVVLPELDDFKPSGDGRSALARAHDWLKVDCPECGGPAERETDTLDTYICSSWYMYRYFDPFNEMKIFDSDIVNKWAPVDFYNGGDHATAHLLYARFVTRFFSKIGLVNNPEPFAHMLFNGKVMASDGSAFSKSKGNGVDPLDIIDQGYGADALRTYLMFAAPLEFSARWDPQGVPGAYRFLNRLWTLVQEFLESNSTSTPDDVLTCRSVHKTIKKVSEDIDHNRYNTAIAALMECVNELYKVKAQKGFVAKDWHAALSALCQLVAPFAPHIADELWNQLGHDSSVQKDSWPTWDEKYLQTDEIKIVVQVNGKLRGEISVPADATEQVIISAARDNEKVAAHLNQKEVRKTIYVPQKLVNFVV